MVTSGTVHLPVDCKFQPLPQPSSLLAPEVGVHDAAADSLVGRGERTLPASAFEFSVRTIWDTVSNEEDFNVSVHEVCS